MAKLFISYRRLDSAPAAQAIYDKLAARYGAKSVLFDVDTIPKGIDFAEYLNEQVSNCDVLLAVIGDHWLEVRSEDGTRRIENADDFVRFEILAALQHKIPVIPVLVGTADIPSEEALPDELKPLKGFNATEVRSGRDWHTHLSRLVRDVEDTIKQHVANERIRVYLQRYRKVSSTSAKKATSGTTSVSAAVGRAFSSLRQPAPVLECLRLWHYATGDARTMLHHSLRAFLLRLSLLVCVILLGIVVWNWWTALTLPEWLPGKWTLSHSVVKGGHFGQEGRIESAPPGILVATSLEFWQGRSDYWYSGSSTGDGYRNISVVNDEVHIGLWPTTTLSMPATVSRTHEGIVVYFSGVFWGNEITEFKLHYKRLGLTH